MYRLFVYEKCPIILKYDLVYFTWKEVIMQNPEVIISLTCWFLSEGLIMIRNYSDMKSTGLMIKKYKEIII